MVIVSQAYFFNVVIKNYDEDVVGTGAFINCWNAHKLHEAIMQILGNRGLDSIKL